MPLIQLVNCVHIVSCVGKDMEQLERLQMNVTSVTYQKKVKEIDLFSSDKIKRKWSSNPLLHGDEKDCYKE